MKDGSTRRTDLIMGALLVALVLLSWAPRIRGPIDLRYDAGIYYVLGTSLAQGQGYRLLHEPGEPLAIQYPPLLPSVVAAFQRCLGSSDPDLVGRWLKVASCLVCIAYALSIFALGRRFLGASASFIVAAIPFLDVKTAFLSNLLFTEILYGLITVLFVLPDRRESSRVVQPLTATLGIMAYLTRTSGLALLAAWVGSALLQRRWKPAAIRAVIALIPVLAWQGYTSRVTSSDAYRRPAYDYQRAPYLQYNVSYAENLLLVDPFEPERGRAGLPQMAARIAGNLVHVPGSFGVYASVDGLTERLRTLARQGPPRLSEALEGFAPAITPAAGWLILLASLAPFLAQRDWLIPLYLAASLALLCLTPWPDQLWRYVHPLLPFVVLGAVRSLLTLASWLRNEFGTAGRNASMVVLAAFLLILVVPQLRGFVWVLRNANQVAYGSGSAEQDRPSGGRLLFYDDSWYEYDQGIDRLKALVPDGAVIATSMPQWAYLQTGLKAVMPPMEADPDRARELLDSVPVSFLVVDRLAFQETVRRYALPVLERHPDRWEPVDLGVEGLRAYRRREAPADPEASEASPDRPS